MATLEAWRRFVANVPEAQREYRTIEVFHPQAGLYRYVANYVDISLILEDSAPRNAAQSVLFQGKTLRITEPAERQDSEQTLSIEFGNIDGTIHRILDGISGAGFFSPAEVIYRKYYSGDLSSPVVPPLYLSASGVVFEGPMAVKITAEDADLSQKRSGFLYTLDRFPGLAE